MRKHNNNTRKLIGIRNGLKIYKPLKSHTKMRQISSKQVRKNNVLNQSRKVLKAQAGELCMVCHRPPNFEGLQVHHKVFRSHNGTNEVSNLILICSDCHRNFHGVK